VNVFKERILMTLFRLSLVAVLAILLASLFVAKLPPDLILTGLMWLPLIGAVTVTYAFPVAGTTPPTATQMNQPGGSDNLVTGTVNMADADTVATVTHAMGLSAAEVSALFPLVNVYPTGSNTGTVVVAVALASANTITVSKLGNVGSGGTFNFWIARPHSLIR
jgi:hypothetical protein